MWGWEDRSYSRTLYCLLSFAGNLKLLSEIKSIFFMLRRGMVSP